MSAANDNTLSCWGVGRDAENALAVIVSFSRPLTDDELRFFHEVCERSAPLMVLDALSKGGVG